MPIANVDFGNDTCQRFTSSALLDHTYRIVDVRENHFGRFRY